jgi:hypothetical protein
MYLEKFLKHLAHKCESVFHFLGNIMKASFSTKSGWDLYYITRCKHKKFTEQHHHHHHHRHHHKHPGLGHLARSVSKIKVALSIVPLVSQLFSFRVG